MDFLEFHSKDCDLIIYLFFTVNVRPVYLSTMSETSSWQSALLETIVSTHIRPDRMREQRVCGLTTEVKLERSSTVTEGGTK